MASLALTEFTDPACPYAFSAEPQRRRLEWLYGDQLDWTIRMVVLREPGDSPPFSTERHAQALTRVRDSYGMPIDPRERPRLAATEPACRAVVAARLRAGRDAQRALLRRLRVLDMTGELIDEPEVIDRAAREAGLTPESLRAWMQEDEVHAALREDMAAARRPSREGRALGHKLGCSGDIERYTCPSYLLECGGRQFTVPGFQPIEAYEVAIANLAPHLQRRDAPESVDEVLAWAGEPLSTAEVAAVCEIDPDEARTQLARVAELEPVGADGYWAPGALRRAA